MSNAKQHVSNFIKMQWNEMEKHMIMYEDESDENWKRKKEFNCYEKYSATEFLFKLKLKEKHRKVKNDVKRTLSSLKLKCFHW